MISRTPKEMREDALAWSRAGYPAVAVGRYRDAADEIEKLTRERDEWAARTREFCELLSKWIIYCDLSGAKPVSGDLRDNPVLALIVDSRKALAKPVPSYQVVEPEGHHK